jgi:hypothetical protein
VSAKTDHAPPPGCLWLPQAAERLGVKPRTLHAWRTRNRGPAGFRYAGRVIYREEAIEAYLAECEAADRHSKPSAAPGRAPQAQIIIPERANRPKRRKAAA